jgi:hypothetical protein
LNRLPQALHLRVFSMLGHEVDLENVEPARTTKKNQGTKKEEELSLKEPEENPKEENGSSDRHRYGLPFWR